MKHIKKFNESFLGTVGLVIAGWVGVKLISRMILSDFVKLYSNRVLAGILKKIETEPGRFSIKFTQSEENIIFNISLKNSGLTSMGESIQKAFPLKITISNNGKSVLQLKDLKNPLTVRMSEKQYNVLENYLKKYGEEE